MTEICTGCGKALEAASTTCPACSAPAVGAAFEGEVEAVLAGQAVVPEVCCCCLGPREVTAEAKAPMSFEVSMQDLGIRQRHLPVPLPWCRRCRRRASLLFGATLLAFVLGSLAAVAALALVLDRELGFGYVAAGMVAGGLFAGLVRLLLRAALPKRRGHVKGCLAVGLSSATLLPDGKSVRLRINLRNRAFAGLWLEAQRTAGDNRSG